MSLFRRNLIANASGGGNWDFIGTFIVANDDTSWLFNEHMGGDYYNVCVKGLSIALTAGVTYTIQVIDKRNKKIVTEINNTTSNGTAIGMATRYKENGGGSGTPVEREMSSSEIERFIPKCPVWYPIENFVSEAPLYFDVYIKANAPFTIRRTSITFVSSAKSPVYYYNNQLYSVDRQSNKVTIDSNVMYS